MVLDVRTPGCLLAEFPHAFCRLTCLIRIGLCAVRHGPVRGGDQPGPSETRGAFPEACSEVRLRAGPCSVRRQLLFYIRTPCSLRRNLAVRTCRYRTQARRKQDTYVCTHVRTYLVHPPGTCALISSCERASPPCAPHCAFSFREGHSPSFRPVHLQGKRIRTYICFLIRPPCLLAADRPPLPPVHTCVLGGPEVVLGSVERLRCRLKEVERSCYVLVRRLPGYRKRWLRENHVIDSRRHLVSEKTTKRPQVSPKRAPR